ncbi:unnamed protein product [Ostreobium quekettii]|uniref:Protein kinase domain-containing protein n=1 Tax=Ostreobium quekettii TaxID=121088 RepID=A0A8S1J5K5_9CHLO|nr:unnamed protein product [Ostreobium quekettii]|eukprot:evm.model.scf_1574.1 EVM.evm.TU.scf_1574.1   scf_1574:19941-22152(-)
MFPKDAACSFTYNQDMMEILKEVLDILLSEVSDTFGRQHDAIATVERLLAAHSQPFDVKNFYSRRQVREEISALMMGSPHLFRALYLQWFCLNGDEPLYAVIQHTFTSVATGADSNLLPEQYAPIVQRLETEMQSWRIIDDDEVVLGDCIHSDSFDMVYNAQWDDEVVAVKSRSWWVDKGHSLACFTREAAVHASLTHPNVVQLYGITPTCKLVTELPDGNLRQMCQGKTLEWRVKRSLLQQASAGLMYLHTAEEPVVHGSVSSLNIVTFGTDPDSCIVKLADFGGSASGEYAKKRFGRIAVTNSEWECPENLVTMKSDVFSSGVVAYEVVSGKLPYARSGFQPDPDLHSLKTCHWEEPCPVRPIDCPTEMHQLMKRCCSIDPAERPTMEEVNQCLMELPKEWSREVNTKAVARRVCNSLRQSRAHAMRLRYNRNLMQFWRNKWEKRKPLCAACQGSQQLHVEPRNGECLGLSWMMLCEWGAPCFDDIQRISTCTSSTQ